MTERQAVEWGLIRSWNGRDALQGMVKEWIKRGFAIDAVYEQRGNVR